MAADRSRPRSKEKETGEKKDYDPKLDFFSEQFDPLKALEAPDVKPPIPNALIYDNIAAYTNAHSEKSAQRLKKTVTTELKAGKSEFQRNWLPHQLPIRKERKNKCKNLFTRMDATDGPLSVLKECIEKRIKVKIFTRHGHGIRGYITAFVTMFDKHWNMSLEDVVEVWTRPTKRKIPSFETVDVSSVPLDLDNQDSNFPEVTVIKTEKKLETCRRQLDQLFMRGEHVAFVSILHESPENVQSATVPSC